MAKSLFEVPKKDLSDKYSHKILAPQYVPSRIKPKLDELWNYTKYAELLSNIDKSTVSDEEKKFLKFAASRHIIFNYAKIADYYSHASKDMQKLMEESALVIIDFNDAVANGYVRLSKAIDDIVGK